jgi:hypothetical protein
MHFHHIFAAHVLQEDSTASSMVQGDIYYPTIVTPSLVSAVCQFIKNIVVLAPQDTFSCLKKDNFIQIFTKSLNTINPNPQLSFTIYSRIKHILLL